MTQPQPDRIYLDNGSTRKSEVHRGSRFREQSSNNLFERGFSREGWIRKMLRTHISVNEVGLRGKDHPKVLIDQGKVKAKGISQLNQLMSEINIH